MVLRRQDERKDEMKNPYNLSIRARFKIWKEVFPPYYARRVCEIYINIKKRFLFGVPRISFWTSKSTIFGKTHRAFHISYFK